MSYSLQILTFHRILPEGEDYFIPPMTMSAKTFSKLVRWLARLTEIVDLGDAGKSIRAGSFQGRAAAITFDDGYKDNFDIAGDILKKAGIPATFFIPVYPIDKGESYWWDQLYHLAQRDISEFLKWLKTSRHAHIITQQPVRLFCRSMVQYLNSLGNTERLAFLADITERFGSYDGERLLMTWDEIRRLQKDGFSIGSHSLSHIPLTDLTPDHAEIEIRDSKIALSEKLNTEISGFCYPRGACNADIALMAKEAGYEYAVTTVFGGNHSDCDLYRLSRRNMSDYQESGHIFRFRRICLN
ncbi:MAG: polysaccharide deacetylase family protein [Desulfobacteraceae bacterium]|nr:polysaccharide deacetylase family protein [Desulfobacteraceae bacterium]